MSDSSQPGLHSKLQAKLQAGNNILTGYNCDNYISRICIDINDKNDSDVESIEKGKIVYMMLLQNIPNANFILSLDRPPILMLANIINRNNNNITITNLFVLTIQSTIKDIIGTTKNTIENLKICDQALINNAANILCNENDPINTFAQLYQKQLYYVFHLFNNFDISTQINRPREERPDHLTFDTYTIVQSLSINIFIKVMEIILQRSPTKKISELFYNLVSTFMLMINNHCDTTIYNYNRTNQFLYDLGIKYIKFLIVAFCEYCNMHGIDLSLIKLYKIIEWIDPHNALELFRSLNVVNNEYESIQKDSSIEIKYSDTLILYYSKLYKNNTPLLTIILPITTFSSLLQNFENKNTTIMIYFAPLLGYILTLTTKDIDKIVCNKFLEYMQNDIEKVLAFIVDDSSKHTKDGNNSPTRYTTIRIIISMYITAIMKTQVYTNAIDGTDTDPSLSKIYSKYLPFLIKHMESIKTEAQECINLINELYSIIVNKINKNELEKNQIKISQPKLMAFVVLIKHIVFILQSYNTIYMHINLKNRRLILNIQTILIGNIGHFKTVFRYFQCIRKYWNGTIQDYRINEKINPSSIIKKELDKLVQIYNDNNIPIDVIKTIYTDTIAIKISDIPDKDDITTMKEAQTIIYPLPLTSPNEYLFHEMYGTSIDLINSTYVEIYEEINVLVGTDDN